MGVCTSTHAICIIKLFRKRNQCFLFSLRHHRCESYRTGQLEQKTDDIEQDKIYIYVYIYKSFVCTLMVRYLSDVEASALVLVLALVSVSVSGIMSRHSRLGLAQLISSSSVHLA